MKIFWDYRRSFMGLSLIVPMIKKVVIFPTIFVASVWILQYGLTSNVYFDEYDGDAKQTLKIK